MIIETTKYANQKLSFYGKVVEFKGGKAEVDDNLGQMILDSKFPYIFAEGKVEREKSSIEKMLENELSDKETVMKAEIDRLNKIIESKDLEIKKKENEVQLWKDEVEKIKAKSNSVFAESVAESVAKEVKNEAETGKENELTDDEVMKQLDALKKDELLDMAKNMNIETTSQMTKATLIDLIIAESKK